MVRLAGIASFIRPAHILKASPSRSFSPRRRLTRPSRDAPDSTHERYRPQCPSAPAQASRISEKEDKRPDLVTGLRPLWGTPFSLPPQGGKRDPIRARRSPLKQDRGGPLRVPSTATSINGSP